MWATVGLHPHDAVEGVDGIAALLDPLDPIVVGLGECGLDYHYDYSPRAVQREVFAAQIALAAELDLTLVVHTREAWDDTFDILAAPACPSGGYSIASPGVRPRPGGDWSWGRCCRSAGS